MTQHMAFEEQWINDFWTDEQDEMMSEVWAAEGEMDDEIAEHDEDAAMDEHIQTWPYYAAPDAHLEADYEDRYLD